VWSDETKRATTRHVPQAEEVFFVVHDARFESLVSETIVKLVFVLYRTLNGVKDPPAKPTPLHTV
jgi:hypothetical protein